MKVFLAFDGNIEAVPFLESALTAWSKVKLAEPEVIEVKAGELFEVHRRVIADGLAKDFYILADIDAKPEEAYCVKQAHKHIAANPKIGLAFLRPLFNYGSRVRVIRNGLVEKWPPKVTDNYDAEHAEQIVKAGRTVETWDLWYRHLPSPIIH